MLSFIYVIQCRNTSSQLSEKCKKNFCQNRVVAKFDNTLRLTLDEKCQTLTMLQLNVVHLGTRKILIFNNLYIIHDSFEKKWWQDVLNFNVTRDQLIDWHLRMTRLCYSQRLEDVYKTLINVAEAYL